MANVYSNSISATAKKADELPRFSIPAGGTPLLIATTSNAVKRAIQPIDTIFGTLPCLNLGRRSAWLSVIQPPAFNRVSIFDDCQEAFTWLSFIRLKIFERYLEKSWELSKANDASSPAPRIIKRLQSAGTDTCKAFATFSIVIPCSNR